MEEVNDYNVNSYFDSERTNDTGHTIRRGPDMYLNITPGPGEDSKTTKVRILPSTPNDKRIAIPINLHAMTGMHHEVGKDGFKKFICLNEPKLDTHDNRGCPICRLSDYYFEKGNNINVTREDGTIDINAENQRKELFRTGFSYRPKVGYIVRVIERGAEDKGVKYWRFMAHSDKTGFYDILQQNWQLLNDDAIATYKAEHPDVPDDVCKREHGYNMFDLDTGRDVIIYAKRSSQGRGKISYSLNINPSPTKLSSDKEQVERWINDYIPWTDVYSVKPYEYLYVAMKGKKPLYDRELGIYVDPEQESNRDLSDSL